MYPPHVTLLPVSGLVDYMGEYRNFYMMITSDIVRHLIQGRTDPVDVVEALIGEDVIPELRPCTAHHPAMFCSACEDHQNTVMMVMDYIYYIKEHINASQYFIEDLAPMSVQGGVYDAQVYLYDANTLAVQTGGPTQ